MLCKVPCRSIVTNMIARSARHTIESNKIAGRGRAALQSLIDLHRSWLDLLSFIYISIPDYILLITYLSLFLVDIYDRSIMIAPLATDLDPIYSWSNLLSFHFQTLTNIQIRPHYTFTFIWSLNDRRSMIGTKLHANHN